MGTGADAILLFVLPLAAPKRRLVNLCQSRVRVWRRVIATNTDERFLPLNCHPKRGVGRCNYHTYPSYSRSLCKDFPDGSLICHSFVGPSLGTRYIPELWWGSRDPFVSFTSGKSINVRLSLLPISPLPLIHLNNSKDSLITPSIRQTRSTSGSGCLHRKPKSERRSRSTCSHQAGRGIDLDLGRRGGRHRRPSTTIVERPSQNSTAKVNQAGFKKRGSISATRTGLIRVSQLAELTVQILPLTPFEGFDPASTQKLVPANWTEVDPLWTFHLCPAPFDTQSEMLVCRESKCGESARGYLTR
jgi:hypothetical protein